MQLPFSTEQFLGAFAEYNRAFAPLDRLLPLATGAAVAWVIARPRHFRLLLSGVGALWIWTSVTYFLAVFTAVTRLAYVFAAGFLVEGALLIRSAHRESALPSPRADAAGFSLGMLWIGYALVLYPPIAYLAGQRYPAMPTFPLPCPLTILTLGIFAWRGRSLSPGLLVVPGLWALVGISAAVNFGVVEDLALPLAFLTVLGVQLARRGTPRLRRA